MRHVALLLDRGFLIRKGALDHVKLELTEEGHVAFADYQIELQRRRYETIRYCITTAIAISAPIISIVK